ncbi:MAG: rhamnogalacturonan acetylesterase [Phycisphaerae bacterium]|nr:MAG: rhamnogalacturonan acetylesterase [Phycisphaerae bacterium]
MKSPYLRMGVVLLTLSMTPWSPAQFFYFGNTNDKIPAHAIRVSPESRLLPDGEYGFTDHTNAHGARVFAVKLREGNYRVTIRLGDAHVATNTTIKAEARRLMLYSVTTAPGEYVTKHFTVSVRQPEMLDGSRVSLKSGEEQSPSWDEYLWLEINGDRPGVQSIEIVPVDTVTTVFLAGDSTVTDQGREPWGGWGQMLPRFFKPDVVVTNLAQSGLTLTSFERQNRLKKILSMMKPGDYVLIQFGHNDQKEKGENVGPFTSYKANLKRYVEKIREKGGNPVLVSSMERRRWEDGKPGKTLSDFAQAVRQTGTELDVPVIDLNTMSLQIYEALGESGSARAFAHYPANTFPGQDQPLKDNSHHNSYGAYELARAVVESIRQNIPGLAAHLAEDVTPFDPTKPDNPDELVIPPSPFPSSVQKPEGN